MKLIKGLAGTAKSTYLQKNIEIIYQKDYSFLFLCFNRNIRSKLIQSNPIFTIHNTHTVHSFCYYVLRELGKLPNGFCKIDKFDRSFFEVSGIIPSEEPKLEDFNKLINIFLNLKDNEIAGYNYDVIALDEYQDFREDYIQVVKRIKDQNPDTELYIAGDPLQKIYSYQNRTNIYQIRDNFSPDRLKSDFGITDYEDIKLTINYRTTPAILNFINGYLVNSFENDTGLQYTIDESSTGILPVVYQMTHQKDELEYVRNEISNAPEDKTKVILARYNRDLEIYKNNCTNLANTSISTIHTFKGDDADYIFFVGFDPATYDDEDKENLNYVAISRPKEQLYVTSSYPTFDPKDYFQTGTYNYLNEQKKVSRTYDKLKKIKDNRNFTLNKLIKSNIDSIRLKIDSKDAPFNPYVPNGKTEKKKFSNSLPVKDGSVEYSLEKNHRHGFYFFNFLDLNPHKKNSYNDSDILHFSLNKVKIFFDERVNPKDIKLQRLDLCRLFKFDTTNDMINFINDVIHPLIKSGKIKSIFKQNYKAEKKDYKESIEEVDLFHNTIYINHLKSKYTGMTTVIYLPAFKVNHNKIHIPNLIKIELRGVGRFLQGKEIFGGDNSITKVMEIAKNDGLKKEFEKWLTMYYTDKKIIQRLLANS